MKLTIDRTRWIRGEGSYNSYLLRPQDGKMCCIGFLAKAHGIPDRDILDKHALIDVQNHDRKLARYDDTEEHEEYLDSAYQANDDSALTDVERELKITGLLAEMGVEATFIN